MKRYILKQKRYITTCLKSVWGVSKCEQQQMLLLLVQLSFLLLLRCHDNILMVFKSSTRALFQPNV